MFPRALTPPSKSFFLFGPRGTGKSTWLKANIRESLRLDFLNSSQFLDYSADPSRLRDVVGSLKKGAWVVIDEVQRVPEILNEVHSIYEERGLNFALSGSSARKLKRGGANLLAGRALLRRMYPLSYAEFVGGLSLRDAVDWGTLPLAAVDPRNRRDTLAAYVETYLREELLQEGLIRQLEPFARFLRISGVMNAQVLNIENVSREAHVSRTTVDNYFRILEDTLIGTRLYPYQPSVKIKEISHPKFYYFDSGVARGCAGLLDEAVDSVWQGFALETFLLNELQAHNHYARRNRPLHYYRVSGGYEIDFLIETRTKTLSRRPEVVCIEAKHSKKWDRRWCEPIRDFAEQSKVDVKASFGVYLGDESMNIHGMRVLPLAKFLGELHAGAVF